MAFAVSLLVHGAIALALAGLVSTHRMARGDEFAPLAVRLVEQTPPSPAPSAPVPVEALVATEVTDVALPTAAEEPRPDAPPEAPSRPSPLPETRIAAEVRPESAARVPAAGTVAVAENYAAFQGMSNDLVTRTQGTYIPEVEIPVRIVEAPEVAYPPKALEEGRQDTVLAWLAIDTQGAIEEVVIESADAEFADAVRSALPRAKFLPASERGSIIRYYIVLQFDFRATPGAAKPATTSATSVEPGRR